MDKKIHTIFLRTNLSEGDGIFTPENYTGSNTNIKVQVLSIVFYSCLIT